MNKKPYRPGPKRPSNATRPRGRNRKMAGKNDQDTNAINDEIRAKEVRLVGDNVEQGIYPIDEALKIAEGQELDLILIAPQADPPVCRVMDYQKFKFQQRKHAKEFLEEGNKVRAYVFFRGRSILFKEQGEVLLLRFANDLEEYGKLDQMPVLEGKRMTIMLSPKKPGSKKKEAKDASTGDASAQQDNTPSEE